ncbi:MAG TPA: ATP-binding protein [Kofleriaceae bacterium]
MRRNLGFSGDGATIAIAGDGGVHLADTADRRPPTFHQLPGTVDDLAPVGSELWLAAASKLYRVGASHELTPVRELWGAAGALRECATGEPGALWTAAPPAVVLANGSTSAIALPDEPDCAIPVSPSRWLLCRRDRVQLRDPGTERWAVTLVLGAGRVVDGAVLFGGRSVALVVASGGALAQLLVLGLHDGTLHHRITLSGVELVRFAPARGYALMRSAGVLVLLDLRFGQLLKEHDEPRPVLDAAIDPAGQAFAVRYGDATDDVSVGSIREMLAATTKVFEAPVVVEAMPEAAAEVAPAAAPQPAAQFHHGTRRLGPSPMLAPRSSGSPTSIAAAAAVLELHREAIAAMAGAAIARAWDEGRLSAPDKGGLPFRAEVEGLRGRSSGGAAEDLSRAAREVDDALDALARLVVPEPLPLDRLAAELGLTPVAQRILLAIAAPSLWGELARLYGILSNDIARPLVDELLVCQLLDGHAGRHEIAAALDRDAPLVRYGVVTPGAGKMRPFISLAVDPLVLRLLRGGDFDVELAGMRVVRAFRAYDDLLVPGAVKDDVALRLATAPATSAGRIVVRGRNGAGRHATLAAIAAASGRALAVIDATMIIRDLRRRGDELAVALRRANLAGMLPCIDGLEAVPSDDAASRDELRRILDEHPGPLALRLPQDAEPPLAPGYLGIDLPALSMEQRTATWRALLAEHGLDVRDPGELADRYRVGPAVIARACAQVAARSKNGERADAGLSLETAVRQHLETRLRATAVRVERLASWSRVILPLDIQESVLELIARIKHRRTVYEQWGLGDVMTTARGVTALFQGGPGTGKTLVASAIANELGMDLYRVDLSRIMSKWIGETEQNLAKLFDAAEDGHTIVLFDEADSLFAKRTEVKSSVDRYANLEVNYLLQRLDTFEGIAILTTNFGTSIDSAFKRRLSFRLTFPFPDEDAREQLWRSHLPSQLPTSGDFDLASLARRYRLSGGYIRNAAVRAAFLAAEEHSPLTQDHLERAIKAEFREIGKLAESGVLE